MSDCKKCPCCNAEFYDYGDQVNCDYCECSSGPDNLDDTEPACIHRCYQLVFAGECGAAAYWRRKVKSLEGHLRDLASQYADLVEAEFSHEADEVYSDKLKEYGINDE